jgi:hypothetical protein
MFFSKTAFMRKFKSVFGMASLPVTEGGLFFGTIFIILIMLLKHYTRGIPVTYYEKTLLHLNRKMPNRNGT